MESAIWKDIPNFEGYEVSTEGNIRNKRTGILRILDQNSRGYLRIRILRKGVYHRLMAHRCVALAFIPNPEGKPCVDHINGNRADNRLENLRWTTVSENMLNQKMKSNKTFTRFKNVAKAGKKFKWRITVNGHIHSSAKSFESEEEAYKDFRTEVEKLTPYCSFPLPRVLDPLP